MDKLCTTETKTSTQILLREYKQKSSCVHTMFFSMLIDIETNWNDAISMCNQHQIFVWLYYHYHAWCQRWQCLQKWVQFPRFNCPINRPQIKHAVVLDASREGAEAVKSPWKVSLLQLLGLGFWERAVPNTHTINVHHVKIRPVHDQCTRFLADG